MLDFERLAFQLLTAALPDDMRLLPELDVGDLSKYPIALFSVDVGASLESNAFKPTAWDTVLNFTVLDDSRDGAAGQCAAIYDAVWRMNDPWGTSHTIEGLGHVAQIEDQAVFSRILSATVGDREITHYAGSFAMQMHDDAA